jgi:quinol monooxygenase YgiN
LYIVAGAEDMTGRQLYIVNTAPTEADAVWVTEVWRSRAEHEASLAAEDAKALIGRALPLLAAPPERIDILPVGGEGLATE